MTPTGRRRTETAPIRRILLVRPRRIGDIVLTTPAAAAVHAAFPEARLTYLVESPYARLVSGNPIIDEVISVEPHQGLIAFLRLAAMLRRMRFDAAIDFHGGPRAARLTRLSGARIRVGYEIPGRRFDYHVRVPRGAAGAPVHSVVNHVNLVRALAREAGAGNALSSNNLEFGRISALSLPEADAAEKERVTRFLQEHGAEGVKLVVMHVGAGNRFRDWGEANWAELAARLAAMPEISVILTGGPEDRARAAAMVEGLGAVPNLLPKRDAAHSPDKSVGESDEPGSKETAASKVELFPESAKTVAARQSVEEIEADRIIDATGIFNLIELRELIARARLFVGPDSGPMHIAASTATPIVAIFGPTLPAHFAPWRREAVRILESRVPCRPCRQRRCDREYECLGSTTAAEVFAACAESLP